MDEGHLSPHPRQGCEHRLSSLPVLVFSHKVVLFQTTQKVVKSFQMERDRAGGGSERVRPHVPSQITHVLAEAIECGEGVCEYVIEYAVWVLAEEGAACELH